MTAPLQHRLAVDLGTSTTVAMLQWPDGRVRPLLFDGSPLLASAVLLGQDGRLQTGAARRAGLPPPRLIGEPVAAATYFAHTMGPAMPLGSLVLVYDLGAGTCDLTLLRRQPQGFDIVASDGLNDVGGLDVDAAIVAFLQASYGELWKDAVSRRQLWEDVRNAKEMLSRTTQTVITIPSLGTEVPLGREQFNGLIAPVLRPTISMTRSLLLDADTANAPSTAVVLVGGASRVPLVAAMLHEALDIPPVVIEQPELVVAEGALHATAPGAVAPRGATGAMPAPRHGGRAFGGFPAGSAPVSGGFPPTAAPVSGGGLAGPVSGDLIPVTGDFTPIGDPAGTSGPNAPAPVSATSSSNGSSNGNGNGNGNGKAKYNPEATFPNDFNMCQKVDVGHFATSFEKESSSPLPFSQLANNISTASCTFVRLRGTAANLNLTITASIYADTNVAASQQKNARVAAQQVDPTFKTIANVGDEAILYRNKATDPSAHGHET